MTEIDPATYKIESFLHALVNAKSDIDIFGVGMLDEESNLICVEVSNRLSADIERLKNCYQRIVKTDTVPHKHDHDHGGNEKELTQ
jgi:hypothetical protein